MSLESIQDHYETQNIRHPILIQSEAQNLQNNEQNNGNQNGQKPILDKFHNQQHGQNDGLANRQCLGQVKGDGLKGNIQVLNGSRRRYDYLNKCNETLLQDINVNEILRIQPRIRRQRVQQKLRNNKIRRRNISIESLDKKKAQFTQIQKQIQKQFYRTFENKKNETNLNVQILQKFTKSQQLNKRKSMILKNEEIQRNFNEKSKSFEIKTNLLNFQNIQKSLINQIFYQNKILKKQTQQYKNIINKLELDLCLLKQQLINMKQYQLIQSKKYQDQINKLNKQIEQQKNRKQFRIQQRDLNGEQISKLKSKGKKTEELIKKDESLSMFEKFCANLSMILNYNKQNNVGIMKQYEKLDLNELTISIQFLSQKNKKYEDFINSISEMYCKIQGYQREGYYREGRVSDNLICIKQLWKWLKRIGSFYSFGVEICAIFADKLNIKGEQSLNIKYVLEKAVLRI